MTTAKYVIFNSELGLPVAVIFSPLLVHKIVATALDVPKERLISAGFVEMCRASRGLACYGESVSLGVEARPLEDARLLQDLLEK